MTTAKTKTARITTMLAQGKSVKEIVRVVKVSPQTVYSTRYKLRKASEQKGAITPKTPLSPTKGIAGLTNRPRVIREHDEPVVDAPSESFWRKVWRIVWK